MVVVTEEGSREYEKGICYEICLPLPQYHAMIYFYLSLLPILSRNSSVHYCPLKTGLKQIITNMEYR